MSGNTKGFSQLMLEGLERMERRQKEDGENISAMKSSIEGMEVRITGLYRIVTNEENSLMSRVARIEAKCEERNRTCKNSNGDGKGSGITAGLKGKQRVVAIGATVGSGLAGLGYGVYLLWQMVRGV